MEEKEEKEENEEEVGEERGEESRTNTRCVFPDAMLRGLT